MLETATERGRSAVGCSRPIEPIEANFEDANTFYNSFSRYSIGDNRFNEYRPTGAYITGQGGVPMGWDGKDTVYIDASDTHTLVMGSTGSKKSRMVAIPTVRMLGQAGESMVISDPKAEIYDRTSYGLNELGYDISVLNFRNPARSDAWNPLAIPYAFYCEGNIDLACAFVNDIATNLMLTEISMQDPFWDYCACDLFFGLTILLFKYCKDHKKSFESVNISNLLRLRRAMFWKHTTSYEIEKTDFWRYARKDDIIAASLIGTVGAPDRTQSSILSTFDYKMRIFVIQPDLLSLLDSNTISFDDIDEKKRALYLVIPDEKTSYHKLVALFVKQSYEYMIFKKQAYPERSSRVRVNYVLDEFSSLPTIKDFPTMITAARSRNIRFDLIVQSKHQLLQRYPRDTETIQSNCGNMLFLTSRELPLLEEVSSLCGMSSFEDKKPLVSVTQLQHFDKTSGEALAICGRLKPFITHLPDADVYDRGEYEVLPYPERVESDAEVIRGFELAPEFDI